MSTASLILPVIRWSGQDLIRQPPALWSGSPLAKLTRQSTSQCVILSSASLFISCNTHSASPPHLSVAIAGTESYISSVLQPYVEHFSSKPSDWQTFLRFLLIPLGEFAANSRFLCNVGHLFDTSCLESFLSYRIRHRRFPAIKIQYIGAFTFLQGCET